MFKLKLWQTWTRKMESGCFNSEVCLHLIPFTVCSRLLLKPRLHGNTIWWFMYNWDMNIHINRLTSASLTWNMRFFAGKWLHINTRNTSQDWCSGELCYLCKLYFCSLCLGSLRYVFLYSPSCTIQALCSPVAYLHFISTHSCFRKVLISS